MRLAALLLLVACKSMAPKYERPAAPVPQQLPGGSGSYQNVPWKQFVRTDKLQQIIEVALANNRDLRKAAANIEIARAGYRIQRADLYPHFDAGASVVSSRQISGLNGNDTITTTAYGAQVGLATWEIDLFGKIKSLTNAKQEQYFASVENAKATRISLIGEIATAYVSMAADKARLAIAQDTAASGKKTMELTDALVGGGTSNRGDYYQAATVYQQALADIAQLTAQIAQDKNALDLLCGAQVDPALVPDALPGTPDWFAEIQPGASSEVLLTRPDVAAAEHQLMAANANIGAARAQFFPSLSLTASGGLASLALGALFTGPAAVFSLAPQLGVPLFHAGALDANLDLSFAQKTLMIATYEQAIQSAFRDVADALAVRATIAAELEATAALVENSQKAFDLAQERYKAGVDPFLSTLVQQRALYQAKNAQVGVQLAALANQVTLYRVLGGGLQ